MNVLTIPKQPRPREFGLTLDTNDLSSPLPCDGCSTDIPPGAQYIGGIDSCCGGCSRSLCFACVRDAFGLIPNTEAR